MSRWEQRRIPRSAGERAICFQDPPWGEGERLQPLHSLLSPFPRASAYAGIPLPCLDLPPSPARSGAGVLVGSHLSTPTHLSDSAWKLTTSKKTSLQPKSMLTFCELLQLGRAAICNLAEALSEPGLCEDVCLHMYVKEGDTDGYGNIDRRTDR